MPIYTYACEKGHVWDEVRGLTEAAEVSEGPCEACLEATGGPWIGGVEPLPHGKKVPAQVSVKLSGPGFTPTFYPHRDNKR